ncbi:molybdopterin-guanine dinucleotide biosynthesis protein MobB [Flavobacterium sp. xlx-214]|uniref:DUF5712 family protein n=1 Tax=unclassified Flavobacterium TaxID=196869 RepID=UPI0013D2DD5C|nr:MULTISPECIES: DUF5712 family protein [unclassified Flavobacterium]MBA5793518.1 molybdopterin-guanine dinucleotide biosynthesis protein MobB [Flavobacterium sp. xlx-221]QMI82712.1 molybdopterin-guanine dinucleotide biosynthesis protein MobB [Flavobacterium sp. xlx-214]
MFINITDSETGNNKASSGQLVGYLEKEKRTALEESRENELWFNNLNKNITPQEVRVKIDNNIAKLSRNDAKFFLINISPSEKEIIYLKEQFGEKTAEEKLKEYATCVMDAYARNFKRSGIESGKDLLWYGKLERHRYYHHTDEEVKKGTVKTGQPKEGEQMHVQIIVSRKDIKNKIKLSPMNNSRGRNEQHSSKLGQFDRVAFKESGELLFDQMFDYNRSLKDSVSYALTMKNGNAEQKRAIHLLEQLESKLTDTERQNVPDTAKDIYQNNNTDLAQLIDTIGNSTVSILGTLFSSEPLAYEHADDQVPHFKKKKKRKRRPGGI